ncbi:MAG TPA: hypothetical protein DCY13_11430 [Verrucomicrobiales bacterium]|nr:hypothetical protein [Verrucomicrobiales bacterium]
MVVTALVFLSGCATRPQLDWSSRIGQYTFDQAVIDYGPPDKQAQLSDQSKVVEWVTRRGGYSGHAYGFGTFGHHPRHYRHYPGYVYTPYTVTRSPDRHLRLVFDPDGLLRSWNEFSK